MEILACPSIRLTGSIVSSFIGDSLSELHLRIRCGFTALQQVTEQAQDHFGRRWAARDADIYLYELLKWARLFHQGGDPVRGHDFALIRSLDIDTLQKLVHRDRVPHRRNVAGDRADRKSTR